MAPAPKEPSPVACPVRVTVIFRNPNAPSELTEIPGFRKKKELSVNA